MKKILLGGFIFMIILVLLISVVFFNLFEFNEDNNTLSLKATGEEKSALKSFAREIKRWVYQEATINNPEGDVLPDNLDNQLFGEIKNRIK